MSDKRQQLIQEVMEAMASVRGAFAHTHGPMFKKHGYGMPHLKLMMKMADSDDGVSVSELSEKMGVTPGAITQFIDKLVDKDMVERFEDPKDRRIVRIRLTDKAKAKFQKVRSFYFERTSDMFSNLSDDELKQLAAILKKVEANAAGDEWHGHWKKWHQTKKDIN
ncbi:MAG: MarR family winged helix-turn-helix transcriptional regulator [Candidatus Saccharimonadales bacterium]